ncbi:copper transport protein ATX1 isoform X2 [Curcuma longa]
MAHLQIVPAGSKPVEAQFVEMKVPLYSYGCEKKVKKALSHLRGIHSVHVDYELQKVTVWGICNKDDVLATIKKKRREARFWEKLSECDQAVPSEEKVEEEDEEIHVSSHLPAIKSFKFKRSWKKFFPLLV